MARLEELTRGAVVAGVVPRDNVSVVDARFIGSDVLQLTYRDSGGKLGNELLYRDNEPTLDLVTEGGLWSFDGDGAAMRLVSEARRIELAYIFDPHLAVHTSQVDPLPHQITAVYGEMLPRQPLRYLLADDPGAGKTIMAGLFIKELLIRGDLKKCLIVSPGSLVEQWQDELDQKFHLSFEILTNDKLESARTGNWFSENHLCIARLDKLSRSEEVQAKLGQVDWDLIVIDEAHKMSASFFSGEIKETKRYKLGKFLSSLTRHLLLMTATPHNGKEEDFQLFLALLDGDRFEGRFRDGVHVVDTTDIMRRMVKESLLKFDGTPLFPERRAYTVNYQLSPLELDLYRQVTEYVRNEFDRAKRLENEGKRGTVGFALMALQRRLASSPEAIYQSLRRRRERLEKRLREEKALKRGAEVGRLQPVAVPDLYDEDIEELEDAPESEISEKEDELLDLASAAQTIAELETEIGILKELEALALRVRRGGTDKKWEELSSLLQNDAEMFDAQGHRRKMVIFSEHRDTINYLTERIRALLGQHESVVVIHGAMGREERKKAETMFKQDKDVEILLATDAAGEGINLQRAHLMVNYDLPWNPNRLEQRFGRIHRIGQTEVCHLWNLVASETREGDVFATLCRKLEQESIALNGQVFDILGKAFVDTPLRQLLQEAILYGDKPEVRERLFRKIENALDHERLRQLIEEKALAHDSMDARKVQEIRADMERIEARRLQPNFVSAFFIEAFKRLGGQIYEREPRRYEVTRVPAAIRNRDRQIGRREPVLTKYERISFHKDLLNVPGKPMATFVCPGHPLLDAVIDLTMEQHRELLKRGAILVDPSERDSNPRVLFYLDSQLQDARRDDAGTRRIVSREMHFLEVYPDGAVKHAGPAPYLDYRPLEDNERSAVEPLLSEEWLKRAHGDIIMEFAVTQLVPEHLHRVKSRKEHQSLKAAAAVKDRLTKEIMHWDRRAEELRLKEEAGKSPALNSSKARARVEELESRLQKRLADLEQERKISPLPPNVVGGILVVPATLLHRLIHGSDDAVAAQRALETAPSERRAMEAVMEIERALGFEPRDVGAEKRGYDIESAIPGTGKLRFIEVKGRAEGADSITITKNEILTALNKPEDFILAVVLQGEEGLTVRYVRTPFEREPDFGVTSVNYDLKKLLAKGEIPA
jgi:superfamily II DNA or RNA helicase